MSTFYTIELGYDSGAVGDLTGNQDWSALSAIVRSVRNNPNLIMSYLHVGIARDTYDGFPLADFVNIYSESTINKGRCPLNSVTGSGEDDVWKYLISCSGGGESREAKEMVARAFTIAVMVEAHKQSLNLTITTS